MLSLVLEDELSRAGRMTAAKPPILDPTLVVGHIRRWRVALALPPVAERVIPKENWQRDQNH